LDGDSYSATRLAILEYMVDYFKTHQRLPSLRDISARMGFRSVGGADYHLKRMVRDGLLDVVPGKRSRYLLKTVRVI